MQLPLHYPPFDQLTEGGFFASSVNAVTALPGIGRTKWVLEQAYHASKASTTTLFITLESSIQDSIERLFDLLGKEEIASHPMSTLHFVESNEAKIEDLQQVIETNVEQNNIQMVWIDSLDYLIPENGLFMKEESDYIEAVTVLETVAKQHNLAIVFTKQLERMEENRLDKRPVLSDVGSEAFTASITTVLGLYRNEQELPNQLEVRLLKHGEQEHIESFNETFLKNKDPKGNHTLSGNTKE